MSQRFEGSIHSPFQSRCATKGEVDIFFNNKIEFTSEGRKETLYFYDNDPKFVEKNPEGEFCFKKLNDQLILEDIIDGFSSSNKKERI